jgi:hypothetical protein
MDKTIVEIEPLEFVTVHRKHSFSININDVRIFKSVMMSIDFFDENGNCIDRDSLNLTGEDYSNWGADDNYLVNYVAKKYGMKVRPPATEPVTEPTTEPAVE